MPTPFRITALAGGVGAARFLRGVVRVVPPAVLTVIVNTGDDEEFFGLSVSPDLDTVTYTLAGAVDAEKGWGLPDETHRCLDALERYFPETWFGLGDADLATHLFRTERLRRGEPLSRVTAEIARRWNVAARVLPMSDDRVRTVVTTEDGVLPFQEYFVNRRAEGQVSAVTFRHVETARPAPGVCEAIAAADLIVLPPSNPIVSIGPILALPGVRETLRRAAAPVAAVSPLIAGKPVKGPADRMLAGLGIEVSAAGIADSYDDFVDTFVLDRRDVEGESAGAAAMCKRIEALGMNVLVTETLMRDMDTSVALARTVVRHPHRKRARRG